jgi:hypothetical protein
VRVPAYPTCATPELASGRGASSAGIGFRALFYITESVVEDLPDQAGESMGDHPGDSFVAEFGHEEAENRREMAAFLAYRRLGGLGEDLPDQAIPFGRARNGVLPGRNIRSGTDPDDPEIHRALNLDRHVLG